MDLLKRTFAPFLVCLALVLAGCAAWRHMGQDKPLRFSHEKMLHQSVECVDCHTEAAPGAKVGLPDLDTCLTCHEEIDAKKPPELHVATLFKDGQFKAAKVTILPSEVIFSHKNHAVDQKVACTDCHKGIRESTAITKAVRVSMQDCVDCHAKTPKFAAAPNDCATCHTTIRKDAKPETHLQNWKTFHGQKAKDGDKAGMNDCTLCHTQDSCTTCHKTEQPKSHTNYWRQRGHGITSALDRDSCTTCHQSDFCVSCHQSTAPRSHHGQWGAPKDKHCTNCHFPVAAENCSVCHQGTPSHDQAKPTPPTMVGTDCRSCHGQTPAAKLPHVDNGDNCTYCHH